MKAVVVINFKVYPESVGLQGIRLASRLASIRSEEYEVMLAPSLLVLSSLKKLKMPLFAQSAENIALGAHTGGIALEELKLIGVQGVMLNHAERRLPFSSVRELRAKAEVLGLQVLICAASLREVRRLARLKPEYIAYEPKELIGGKVSVAQAEPRIIIKAVRYVKKMSPSTRLLCGAGIHSRKDVEKALSLGAEGVLLSSAVVKAKNPQKFLGELLSAH